MIGFMHNGKVNYATNIEDFREFMDPGVFEGVRQTFEGGFDGNSVQNYKELQLAYDALQTDYDELEEKSGDADEIQEELDECEEELENVRQKLEEFQREIKDLVFQHYQGYISTEDIIPRLEALIN